MMGYNFRKIMNWNKERKRWEQQKAHPVSTKKFKRKCKAEAKRIAKLALEFDLSYLETWKLPGYSKLPQWARDYCQSLIRLPNRKGE